MLQAVTLRWEYCLKGFGSHVGKEHIDHYCFASVPIPFFFGEPNLYLLPRRRRYAESLYILPIW